MRSYLKFLSVLLFLILSSNTIKAQETLADALPGWADEWKYAFSKEGIKEWKPEFTFRYYSGFTTTGPMLTGGVRVDEKRSLALMVSQGDVYIDHAPGDIYFIGTGLNFRRYWHLGKRKTFAFYSDLYAGAGWIYKVDGKYDVYPDGEKIEVIDERAGDVKFICGWQPGIRVRFYKNIHLFLGPTIATECFGLHLGIGF